MRHLWRIASTATQDEDEMKEQRFETRVVVELLRRGWIVRKFVTPGMRGAADRIVLAPAGVVAFIELKRTDGKGVESSHQRRFRTMAQEFGHLWHVVGSFDGLAKFIRAVEERIACRS